MVLLAGELLPPGKGDRLLSVRSCCRRWLLLPDPAAAAPLSACCCSSSGRRRRCTEEDGGVTFHPPRLPRELAVQYVLNHRREQDRGTPHGAVQVPEAAASLSAGGTVAVREQQQQRRRQQRGERRRLLLTHILAAARSPSAGCCAPPRVAARPLRRAALPPRRDAPPLLRAVLPARLHPGGAPRHRRAPAPHSPPPGRRRGAHLLRGVRMPGALPAPSPARPQLERGGARAACAAGYVWKLERQIAPSPSSPAVLPAPRRGTAARARMHSCRRGGGVIPVTE
ncbi:uncharacterized protein LOC131585430 [Poecile atricapillus]|uniref:uncharacterized protein LOC131585430 n=1 Tax=Poecile atricapillus TaxID=48891 RepID=UPI00273A336A|nr:uncharacterized protein LOC131585430 [Poecile atricapillus]